MGKLDYTNSDLKTRYKTLVRNPDSELSKITVSESEKRTRAELLDMLEELFEKEELIFNNTFQEKFKAILHIMVKSIDNTLDDGVGTAIAANTAKTGISTAQANAISANTSKSGAKGDKGNTGATGAASTVAGPTGPTGNTGPAGSDGDDGAKGDKGDTGDTGAAGNNGSNGSAGARGATGPQGNAGSNGSAGARGATGAAGATGNDGSVPITEGYAVAFDIVESRGAYSITFKVTGGDIKGSKSATVSLS